MDAEAVELSYRALMRIPGFGRVAIGTVLARLAGQMWEIVLVLFVLQRYGSPSLTGLTVLLSILPGLVLSPVAGALLDRQGRLRLMILDYGATAALTGAIALLSLAHRLPVPLLLALVTVLSVSNILSLTGARSLFPLMVPRPLWDRANGFDTSTYSLTTIVGPAIAGVAVARLGPEAALLVQAAIVGLAAVSLVGVREPVERVQPSNSLIRDAWEALLYVVRHPSLRGLAISLFISNLGFGVITVALPVLVLSHLHGNATTVGQVFAVFGLAGLAAGLLVGRLNTDGKERLMMAVGMAVFVAVLAGLAVAGNMLEVFALVVLGGAASSVINIGIFSLRQRRTDPAWFGRAFAVSLSLNFAGAPIGSALSGPLIEQSLPRALLLGAAINVIAAAATLILIPKRAERKPG